PKIFGEPPPSRTLEKDSSLVAQLVTNPVSVEFNLVRGEDCHHHVSHAHRPFDPSHLLGAISAHKSDGFDHPFEGNDNLACSDLERV
ncbi:TPA: hypothetical protein ACKFZV_006036, partial [Burkholderia multivorans]